MITDAALRRNIPRPRAALCGAVASGVGLASGELLCAIGEGGPSLVSAVGTQFINLFSGQLKEFAISVFGTNDKTALVVGIVVICLLLGALLGRLASRHFLIAAGVFGAFGVLGLVCYLDDPSAVPGTGISAVLVGVETGIASLWALLHLARPRLPVPPVPAVAFAPDPALAGAAPRWTTRRLFLAAVGAFVATAAGAAALSRRLAPSTLVEATRQRVVLPEPATPSSSTSSSSTTSTSTTNVPTTTRSTEPVRPVIEATVTEPDVTAAETTEPTVEETTTTMAAPTVDPASIEGVSPYITPNAGFFRIDTAIITPQVDVSSWSLAVTGLVDRPYEIGYDELVAMSTREDVITLQCVSNEVGGVLVGNVAWQGVALSMLLGRAGVQPGATQIVGRSVDDFTAGFPTAVALDGRSALVAVGMNGEPLPVRHGFPARLIVAGLYGYVSATKWLRQIELTTLDVDGYWITRGYSKEGPVKITSRIDVPRAEMMLRPGRVPIAGMAWAPVRGVAAVEVQVDDGPWMAARLGDMVTGNTWVQWVVEWEATPGAHVLQVRATGRDGVVQTEQQSPPAPNGATGWHSRRVRVF